MTSKVIAKAIIRNLDYEILLLRRSKTDHRRPLEWDFPGGSVDDGENFTDAVSRETKEEAGLEISPNAFHLVYSETAIVDSVNVTWLYFETSTKETTVRLSHEHDKFQWISQDEASNQMTYHRQINAFKYLVNNKLI